jgi:hypothetical protein
MSNNFLQSYNFVCIFVQRFIHWFLGLTFFWNAIIALFFQHHSLDSKYLANNNVLHSKKTDYTTTIITNKI